MVAERRPSPSLFSAIYERAYGALCGRHPKCRLWHFQYLALRQTHFWQRDRMAHLRGIVLDVGCGNRPYESWLTRGSNYVTGYIGLDVAPGPGVDIIVDPDKGWPISDASLDVIISTQVLEHVACLPVTLAEMARVLRPGGDLLLTAPFIYPVHGLPHDYTRFTTNGIRKLFENEYEIIEVLPLGKAGSMMGTILLTWLENSTNRNRAMRFLKGLLLPLWLLISLLTNVVCLAIDAIDCTDSHYLNVGLWARRR
jgi:SAM-dependent methyltransferase